MLICLCGYTCSGKTKVAESLSKLGYPKVVTYTTRPIREGEIQDIDYHFVTDEEFDRLESADFFAETSSYEIKPGTTWKYGSSKDDLLFSNKCIIVNPDGLEFYRQIPNTIIIYLYASNDVIWQRLESRGSGMDNAQRRFEADQEDFKFVLDYADFAIKNNGNKTPEQIAYLIKTLVTQNKWFKRGFL